MRMPLHLRKNIGSLDRVLRLGVGAGLIAYALQIGFPATGWNQLGWIGLAPLLTGLAGYCPIYALVEINTCSDRDA
ncbi:MAG: DUF2892 domain-containing protein [Beijerinckiaceae bacterium]|jgi:hypothetical protein|nr:DUF2892 domain-containing protein [Beijerinckiaceae bacterium]